jgi:hypothetical protein
VGQSLRDALARVAAQRAESGAARGRGAAA